MPLPVSDDPITDQGRLYVSPSLPVGDGGLPVQQLIASGVPTTDYTNANGNGNGIAARVINRLLGTGGEQRYQTWPEKLLRNALSAPHDIMQPNPHKEGTEEYYQYENDRQQGMPVIKAALDMSALAGTGGLAGVGEGAGAALGSSPFLRPALRYEGKIYKAPVGGQHMDAIPKDLQPEFTRQAMSGEDISNFNFGFMNHKGQFLDREKALKYAIDEGLMSPHDAKYGALTSTLMADSQAGLATKLTPNEETEYQKWKTKNAPNDVGSDYDLRGAFKAGLNPAENGHFPDTFKMPSHPTFSDESKYSNKSTPGGKWEKTKEGWNFTPSSTNLKYHTKEELQDYLKRSDPTVTLKME